MHRVLFLQRPVHPLSFENDASGASTNCPERVTPTTLNLAPEMFHRMLHVAMFLPTLHAHSSSTADLQAVPEGYVFGVLSLDIDLMFGTVF